MPVSPWGWFQLAFFGIVIPYAALQSRRRIDSGGPLPTRQAAFRTTILSHLLFLGLSLTVARMEGLALFGPIRLTPVGITVAAGMLLGAWACMYPLWRRAVLRRERNLHLFTPRTPAERGWWMVAATAAGVAEEITYRGVIYLILLRLTGSPLGAALVSAAIFALAHLVQGWRAVALTAVFALGFQGLVLVTGGLYLPIVVHTIYDLIAGLTYGRLAAESGYPEEGPPTESLPHRDH